MTWRNFLDFLDPGNKATLEEVSTLEGSMEGISLLKRLLRRTAWLTCTWSVTFFLCCSLACPRPALYFQYVLKQSFDHQYYRIFRFRTAIGRIWAISNLYDQILDKFLITVLLASFFDFVWVVWYRVLFLNQNAESTHWFKKKCVEKGVWGIFQT